MKTDVRIDIPLKCALAALLLSLPIKPVNAASFNTTGALHAARAGHVATLLPNGNVLVEGGFDGTNRLAGAELYNPTDGTWSPTGSLLLARTGHTATLLPNGLVLVAGGGIGGIGTANCELYNPASGTWTNTGSLLHARVRQTATLLRNGKVLITGGSPDAGISSLASAELYDPMTGAWTATGSMTSPRDLDRATLLLNGNVLVEGGAVNGDDYPLLASAELYNPDTGRWTPTGSMTTGRANHASTLLPDGRVLVNGGNSGNAVFPSAELYDPASGSWTATSMMSSPHTAHSATLLANGEVLVVGGYDEIQFTAPTSIAELYDPSSGMWSVTGSLVAARDVHAATLLANGQVLISGGYDIGISTWLASAELYGSAPGQISLMNPGKSDGGNFRFTFAGTPNATNTVLAATNPASPLVSWTVLGLTAEFAPGLYLFTDTEPANTSGRFYCVRSP